jgi:hypothetical protein
LSPRLSCPVFCFAPFSAKFCTVRSCSFFFVRWQELTGCLESVVILEPYGIQLETHRGFLTRLPWLTNRQFIASTHLHGVCINEGLKGWNVRFYLVIIRRAALTGAVRFEVAYQVSNLKSPFLLRVYLARHRIFCLINLSCSMYIKKSMRSYCLLLQQKK